MNINYLYIFLNRGGAFKCIRTQYALFIARILKLMNLKMFIYT